MKELVCRRRYTWRRCRRDSNLTSLRLSRRHRGTQQRSLRVFAVISTGLPHFTALLQNFKTPRRRFSLSSCSFYSLCSCVGMAYHPCRSRSSRQHRIRMVFSILDFLVVHFAAIAAFSLCSSSPYTEPKAALRAKHCR